MIKILCKTDIVPIVIHLMMWVAIKKTLANYKRIKKIMEYNSMTLNSAMFLSNINGFMKLDIGLFKIAENS